MFIKASKFDRLVKEAYRDVQLHMGCDGPNIMVSGKRWMIAMDKDEIPKEILAVIIKYAGRVPAVDEYFQVKEEGLQQELPGSYISLEDLEDKDGEWYQIDPTGVILLQGARSYALYQRLYESSRVIAVEDHLPLVVDPGEVSIAGGERPVRGPFVDSRYRLIAWKSNWMQMQIYGVSDKKGSKWQQLLAFFEQRHIRGIGE